MDEINNYVATFKDFMNNHLLSTTISLAETQELFVEYFKGEKWHLLSQNEKQFSATPFHIKIEDKEGKRTLLTSDFADAVAYADNYTSEYNETTYLSCYAGHHTRLSIQGLESNFKLSIGPIHSIPRFILDNSKLKGHVKNLLPLLRETLRIKKSFLSMTKKEKEAPMPFKKSLIGRDWSIYLCRWRGVSVAIKTEYGGYAAAEIGNASIMESKKGGYALTRYNREELYHLGHLSKQDLTEITETFGIAIGYEHGMDSSDRADFTKSKSYLYYNIWAHDHLKAFHDKFCIGDEGVQQSLMLMS